MRRPIALLAARLAEAGAACARSSVVLLAALVLALPVAPSFASDRLVTVTVETIDYVSFGEDFGGDWDDWDDGAAYGEPATAPALAEYGPFRIVAPDTAELVGDTDSYSPDDFRAMLAAWPGLRTLRLVECGGTVDDEANLRLARMIRHAGLATHVPASGSVRSGGVELFLAGVRRSAEPGAEFLVHSWRDEYGREANDVPISDPVHADYLGYYREVGMAPDAARAFYALTNSVPNDSTRRVSLQELAAFSLLN